MNAKRQIKFVLLAALLVAFSVATTVAQSGTRRSVPGSRRAPAGSTTRTPQRSSSTRSAAPTLALKGYCAVCLRENGEWIRGRSDQQVVYDGKVYYFPGPTQKQMFVANPAKYTPALNGDCTVCKVNMGQRVAGNVNFGVDYRGRFYFFPSAQQRDMFKSNPKAYAYADLAYGGACAVCRVDMNQKVAGREEFAVVHDGMRYLFPGPDQMKMFQAHPTRYAVTTK